MFATKEGGINRRILQSEGWGKGQAAEQNAVIVPEGGSKKLGYELGLVDGKFGPATFAAVEVVQEDVGKNRWALSPIIGRGRPCIPDIYAYIREASRAMNEVVAIQESR